MNADVRAVIEQLTSLLTFFTSKELDAGHMSDSYELHAQFNMSSLAAIERISGSSGPYALQAKALIKQLGLPSHYTSPGIRAILESLKSDIGKGYLSSLEELIHASMFADYLAMAEHLQGEGYKDPAAVLAGGTLEEHLRKLCQKNNIPTHDRKPKGLEPKKASVLNTDLYKAKVYSNAQQQQVTAWLAIRNNAAHGNYDEYKPAEVKLLIDGVRDFIIRLPA